MAAFVFHTVLLKTDAKTPLRRVRKGVGKQIFSAA